MGDRATVLLYSKHEEGYRYSPIIYPHWNGGEVENTVSKMQRYYLENDADRNWEAHMRQEIERVFPILSAYMGKDGHTPSVFNFDNASDFRDTLPTANDVPIVADDRGLYLVDVATLNGTWSEYDWSNFNV